MAPLAPAGLVLFLLQRALLFRRSEAAVVPVTSPLGNYQAANYSKRGSCSEQKSRSEHASRSAARSPCTVCFSSKPFPHGLSISCASRDYIPLELTIKELFFPFRDIRVSPDGCSKRSILLSACLFSSPQTDVGISPIAA